MLGITPPDSLGLSKTEKGHVRLSPSLKKEETRFGAGDKQERPICQDTGYQELLFVYSISV